MKKITAYFDGACEPRNPGGHIGWGYLVVDAETGEVLTEMSGYLAASPKNTNNVAEYTALFQLLSYLYRKGHKDDEVQVFGDSQLAVNQMAGTYAIRRGVYVALARRCLAAKQHFRALTFSHVRREENQRADDLSKKQLTKRGIKIIERIKSK